MQTNLKLLGAISILGATLAISGIALQDAMAANSANKTSYQSADMTFITAEGSSLDDTGNDLLAYAEIKASNPTDVLVLYNEECTLYTEVNLKGKNSGTDAQEIEEVNASHTVELFVNGLSKSTEVTMCDRTYGMSTNILTQIEDICNVVSGSDIDPESTLDCDETFLDSWIRTKAAHGWNWVVVNVGDIPDPDGDGVALFEVKGKAFFDDTDGDNKNSDELGVAIGQRSLIVIPVQLDSGA